MKFMKKKNKKSCRGCEINENTGWYFVKYFDIQQRKCFFKCIDKKKKKIAEFVLLRIKSFSLFYKYIINKI